MVPVAPKPSGRPYSAEITALDSQVRAWSGANVYRWCRERPGKKLDVATAFRWGLTEATVLEERGTLESENGVDVTCEVDKIFYCPLHNSGNLEFLNGFRYSNLESGCYYGVNRELSRWYLILFFTTKIRVVPTTSGSSSEDNDALGLISDMPRNKKLEKLDKYCVQNPGKPYVIDGPGRRPVSTSAHRHYDLNRWILAVNNGFECPISTIVNAIFAYGDEALARTVSQIERRPVVRTLKDLAKWVESEVQTFHIVRYGAVESAYDVNWVVNNCRGVVLVYVIGTGGVNDLVCVDGSAKIIYDSMEWRPMHLSRAAIQCCFGDGSDIRRLFVRKMVR